MLGGRHTGKGGWVGEPWPRPSPASVLLSPSTLETPTLYAVLSLEQNLSPLLSSLIFWCTSDACFLGFLVCLFDCCPPQY